MKSFPLISTCTHTNCCTHFPQFKRLEREDFKKNLLWVVENDHRRDNSVYLEAIKLLEDDELPHLKLEEAAKLAAEDYGYEIYQGLEIGGMYHHLYIHVPCCR